MGVAGMAQGAEAKARWNCASLYFQGKIPLCARNDMVRSFFQSPLRNGCARERVYSVVFNRGLGYGYSVRERIRCCKQPCSSERVARADPKGKSWRSFLPFRNYGFV